MNDVQRRYLSRPAAPLKLHERADGAPPTIVGYAAVFFRAGDPGTEFELWPGVKERIMPGAFDKAIAADGGDDVRALFDHDTGKVLGRRSAGTLKLSVDARGLRYEIDPPDTQTARDLIQSIRRGDITGSSFAFFPRATVHRDDPAGGAYYLERTDLQLFDVGPVTFPAYAGSEAGLRAAGDLAAARAEVEAVRADRDALALTLAAWDAEEGE